MKYITLLFLAFSILSCNPALMNQKKIKITEEYLEMRNQGWGSVGITELKKLVLDTTKITDSVQWVKHKLSGIEDTIEYGESYTIALRNSHVDASHNESFKIY